MFALGAADFAHAGGLKSDAGPLGSTADSILAAGHRLSPQLRAAALDTEAAAARADGAGALPDPTFTINDDEVDRTSGPRINKTYLMVGQTFPLWGKRDLQHSAAVAALDAARGRERAVAVEYDSRVKVAFTRYYVATRAIAINQEVTRLARQMIDATGARYGQGVGEQSGVLLAQAEETRAAAETLRLEAERKTAAARLNVLLNRAADSPLATPVALRPVPASLTLASLNARARSNNPRLYAGQAEIRSAQSEEKLAHRAWYPDVTISAGAIERQNGPTGVTAVLSLSIPLQQGPKEAGLREAAAKLGSATETLAATRAEIDGDLGEALATLEAACQINALLSSRLLPQYQAAYRSLLASYGQGRGELISVLEAEHRLHDTNLEQLRSQGDAQTALATIERLLGEDL